jgi:hypothetical protein
MNRPSRLLLYVFAVIAALLLLGAAGLHYAAGVLKERIEQALGPQASLESITLGLSAVEIRGLRIPGPKGWPAEDALRAQRIVLRPALLDLLSARMRVRSIEVHEAYLSLLRTRDGRLRLLPSLLEGGEKNQATALPDVAIGVVQLSDSVVEFYDGSIRQTPHRLRLEALALRVEDIRLPHLDGRTQLALDGRVKGVQRDGTLTIRGWLELATRNSELATRLHGVDLLVLQPYLIKASEAGVKRGSLDVDLDSKVNNNRLDAPGRLKLNGVELTASRSTLGTFMGLPRNAVIAALKNRQGGIDIAFTLQGNLDDPSFSLNENVATRLAASIAEDLGISLESLARGVESAGQGVSGTLRKLLRP